MLPLALIAGPGVNLEVGASLRQRQIASARRSNDGPGKARQYLGEAYLLKDDVGKAKEQLMEIAQRCGGPCDDYELLVKAIVDHVAGEANVEW